MVFKYTLTSSELRTTGPSRGWKVIDCSLIWTLVIAFAKSHLMFLTSFYCIEKVIVLNFHVLTFKWQQQQMFRKIERRFVFTLTWFGNSEFAVACGVIGSSTIISDCPNKGNAKGTLDSGVADGPSSNRSTVAEVSDSRAATTLPPAPAPTEG